ncbi:helix-turn-helix domain-containing protein [Martelella soudanensis]|uniref:helix-turn-helix domain-containing protein n=1 Tax=unclassified Martelella TaxID=2629616 RepID=UPI0015DF9831|nr:MULTISPECIES: helix-turn-helix domain-containing protein [unclassified Martelella]
MADIGTKAPVLRSSVLTCAADQAAMQPWIDMECFQLGIGRTVCRMETIDFGSQQVVQEDQAASVQKIGATPANLCTLSYCTPNRAFRFSDQGSNHPDTVFFLPENTPFDLYVPAGTRTTYVSFDQAAFIRDARILNPRRWEAAPETIRSWTSPLKGALAADITAFSGDAARERGEHCDSTMIRDLLLQSALQVAARSEGVEDLSRAARARAFAVCSLARAYIESCAESDRLPTIVDICAATGVSERRLQYAFHEYIGMSPNAYLRLLRLNRTRAALAAACPRQTTVTRVAIQHGFLHFGRFAGDYKRIFGETPSATLAS